MSANTARWDRLAKGARVMLAGNEWTVEKLKVKGKRVRVRVTSARGTFDREVKAKDTVELAPIRKAAPKRKEKREPLHDSQGRQNRWATDKEAEHLGTLDPGDPTIIKPPSKATGGLWDTPADKAEKRVGKLLGAVLVAETKNEQQGYYVPPVDVSTVAAHMMVFHGGDQYLEHGEAELLRVHDEHHRQAKAGDARLAVNHWHTEVRP